MTVTTPVLVRPSVGTIRLRSGEQAVTISAGGHRVIVRAAHLDAFIADLEEIEEEVSK